jgi:hypothetical protein
LEARNNGTLELISPQRQNRCVSGMLDYRVQSSRQFAAA